MTSNTTNATLDNLDSLRPANEVLASKITAGEFFDSYEFIDFGPNGNGEAVQLDVLEAIYRELNQNRVTKDEAAELAKNCTIEMAKQNLKTPGEFREYLAFKLDWINELTPQERTGIITTLASLYRENHQPSRWLDNEPPQTVTASPQMPEATRSGWNVKKIAMGVAAATALGLGALWLSPRPNQAPAPVPPNPPATKTAPAKPSALANTKPAVLTPPPAPQKPAEPQAAAAKPIEIAEVPAEPPVAPTPPPAPIAPIVATPTPPPAPLPTPPTPPKEPEKPAQVVTPPPVPVALPKVEQPKQKAQISLLKSPSGSAILNLPFTKMRLEEQGWIVESRNETSIFVKKAGKRGRIDLTEAFSSGSEDVEIEPLQ